ncbi:MAG: relaxase domain-containing protein [bacterium]|nr:relaxase domain-containing protein [bacterium]
MHTHVIVSNKAKTQEDGKWRALDGRPLHAGTVATSEFYNAVLRNILTRDLHVDWDARVKGRDKKPTWEITGVTDELLTEFAGRTYDIDTAADALIDQYAATHGRRPSRETIIRLRQQATLQTRPAKTIHSLAELTDTWRGRATTMLGAVESLTYSSAPPGPERLRPCGACA